MSTHHPPLPQFTLIHMLCHQFSVGMGNGIWVFVFLLRGVDLGFYVHGFLDARQSLWPCTLHQS